MEPHKQDKKDLRQIVMPVLIAPQSMAVLLGLHKQRNIVCSGLSEHAQKKTAITVTLNREYGEGSIRRYDDETGYLILPISSEGINLRGKQLEKIIHSKTKVPIGLR